MAPAQLEKVFGTVLSTSSLKGDSVVNREGSDMGKIEEVMIDVENGNIAYVVVSFGGTFGLGEKLFAIPWQTFNVDTLHKRLILNVRREVLEKAPGFDKDAWPNMADPAWASDLHGYYGYTPDWIRALPHPSETLRKSVD